MSKICPFCKKHINESASVCPGCKRVLIERTGNTLPTQNLSNKNHNRVLFGKLKAFMDRFKNRTTKLRLENPSFNLNYLWLIPVIILMVVIGTGHSANSLSTDALPNTSTTTTESSLPTSYNRLANGTIISSLLNPSSSLGTLEIDNGTDNDAVAKLLSTKGNKSVFTVFVQAKSQFTITRIPDGIYELYFQTGKDWDETKGKFLYYPSFSKFIDNFQYTTNKEETYYEINTHYSTYQVTLNPVPCGTAKTDTVTESEFEKY